MVKDEAELAKLEEHYLACYYCAGRAEKAADHVDAMRQAMCELEETKELRPRSVIQAGKTKL
jgi:hypothetical protein